MVIYFVKSFAPFAVVLFVTVEIVPTKTKIQRQTMKICSTNTLPTIVHLSCVICETHLHANHYRGQ